MIVRRAWMLGGGAASAFAVVAVLWTFGVAQGPRPDPAPSPSPRPQPLHQPDLVYARVGDAALVLDLAMPSEGDGPFPAIVCLHGGGWVGGSRKEMTLTIDALARRGYVAVAPDYRRAPAHRFPAQLEDCKAAVRWLRANATTYKVEPNRIGVVGVAAGGHLSCLLGVTHRDDNLEGLGGNLDQSSGVQAVVSLSGPTDLTQPVWGKIVVERNLVPLLGGTLAQVPSAYRAASPMTYVTRSAPPFLFIHGGADDVVPPSQAQNLAEKLRQVGGSARVVLLDGEGHIWRGERLRWGIAEMLNFFDERLKECSEPISN
jgi:acetyl esterase/lipase